MDHFCYLCFVFVMLSCLVMQPCGHLLLRVEIADDASQTCIKQNWK